MLLMSLLMVVMSIMTQGVAVSMKYNSDVCNFIKLTAMTAFIIIHIPSVSDGDTCLMSVMLLTALMMFIMIQVVAGSRNRPRVLRRLKLHHGSSITVFYMPPAIILSCTFPSESAFG